MFIAHLLETKYIDTNSLNAENKMNDNDRNKKAPKYVIDALLLNDEDK